MTEAQQQAARRVIERLGMSVLGEDPEVVVVVVAAFSREMCERYGVGLEDFFEAVRSARTIEQSGGGSA